MKAYMKTPLTHKNNIMCLKYHVKNGQFKTMTVKFSFPAAQGTKNCSFSMEQRT